MGLKITFMYRLLEWWTKLIALAGTAYALLILIPQVKVYKEVSIASVHLSNLANITENMPGAKDFSDNVMKTIGSDHIPNILVYWEYARRSDFLTKEQNRLAVRSSQTAQNFTEAVLPLSRGQAGYGSGIVSPDQLEVDSEMAPYNIFLLSNYCMEAYGSIKFDWPWYSGGPNETFNRDIFEKVIENYPDDVKWNLYSRLYENKDVINIYWLKNLTWGTAVDIVARMDPYRESATRTRFSRSMSAKPRIKVFEEPIQYYGGEVIRTGETPVSIRFPFLKRGEKVMLIFQSLGRGLSDDFLDVAFQREFFPTPWVGIVIFITILIMGVILCWLENRKGPPVTLQASSKKDT